MNIFSLLFLPSSLVILAYSQLPLFVELHHSNGRIVPQTHPSDPRFLGLNG